MLEQSGYQGFWKMQIAMPGVLLTKRNHRKSTKFICSEYTSGVPDIAVTSLMDGK